MEEFVYDNDNWYNQFYNELQEAANDEILNTTIYRDHLSYKEAINIAKSLQWQQAMERELKDLNSQNT
jgi:hypothetical protein